MVNQGKFQQETIASMALVSQSLELYMRVGLMMLMIAGRLFFLQLLPLELEQIFINGGKTYPFFNLWGQGFFMGEYCYMHTFMLLVYIVFINI